MKWLFKLLGIRRSFRAATPRLEEVLRANLPEGPREALLLVERAMADAQQPLPFRPEDFASALGVRLSWLAREMDMEGRVEPGYLQDQQTERLERQAREALHRVSVYTQNSHQLLFLLGVMVVELVDMHLWGEV